MSLSSLSTPSISVQRPSHACLQAVLAHLGGRRVLVLGDMVADEYIIGRPTRLSREAPIPVLEYVDRYIVPGGATNLARNVRALGGVVAVAGVIGHDAAGAALRARLMAEGIAVDGLAEDAERPTSTKTRVIGGSSQVVSQQIVRIDRVVHTTINATDTAHIIAYLRQEIPRVDALVISDYENGVITPAIIDVAVPLAVQHGIIITVDAHGGLFRFKGVTVATPNQDEVAGMLGILLQSEEDVCRGGQDLVRGMQARGAIITRGSEGMTVVEADGACHHLAASTLHEVRDATGAGDTVSATVTLALAAGASLLEAAHLGNLAASLVVQRLGAATTSVEELGAEIAAAPR